MAKLTKRDRQRAEIPPREGGSALDAVCFHIGRAFYRYVGLVEECITVEGLEGQLRPGMSHIIFALFEEDDVIIKDLVERTQLSPSALTGLLQRMEQAGVIRRHRDKLDGRAVRVCLTPAGRSLEERCGSLLRGIRHRMERGIDEVDLLTTKRVLNQMLHNMRSVPEPAVA